MSDRRPEIEMLWWEGCPSWPRALEELRAAVAQAGLDPGAVRTRQVHTDQDADAAGFPGSPTIRIDGQDVQPPPEGDPGGLTCRVYRRRDGAISPTPDPADVRDALERALSSGRAGRG